MKNESENSAIDITNIDAVHEATEQSTQTDDNARDNGEAITTVGEIEEIRNENNTLDTQPETEIRTVAEILNIEPMKKDKEEVEPKKSPSKDGDKPLKKEENTPLETKGNNTMLWLALLVLVIGAGFYFWQNYKKSKEETIDIDSETEAENE